MDCLKLASALIDKHGVCAEHVAEGLSDPPSYSLS